MYAYLKDIKVLRITLLHISICFVFGLVSHTYATEIGFRSLTTLDGLSQNDVNCIYQDKKGFLWIGTFDGLNRYDGYNFKVFQVTPGQQGGIQTNLIFRMAEDDEGNLWLGSSDIGLIKYNYTTNTFYSLADICIDEISHLNHRIAYVFCSSKGDIWIGTAKGGYIISKVDNNSYRIIPYSELEGNPADVMNGSIRHMFEDDDGTIILSSDDGLFYCVYDTINNKYIINKDKGFPYYSFRIIKTQGRYLVFNYGGIIEFFPNYKTGYFTPGKKLNDLPFIHAILDSRGDLWCGPSRQGLHHYHLSIDEKNELQLELKGIYSEKELGKNKVTALWEDAEGIVWIGLNGGGIQRYVPNSNRFQHYRKTNLKGSLRYNKVRAIYEDSHNNLWIGTEGGGISYLPEKNKQNYISGFTFISTSPTGYSSDDSFCFAELVDGTKLYSGTSFPTHCAELVRNTSNVTIRRPEFVKNINTVFDIYCDSSGYIWLASYATGLHIVHPGNTDSERKVVVHRYEPDNTHGISGDIIRKVIEDNAGNIWIGTNRGLNVLLKSEKYKDHPRFITFKNDPLNYKTISHDYILPILQSSTGDLWIGTLGGGLNKLIPGSKMEESTFEAITKKDGLPNNIIKAILEDDLGNLWITTNRGLTSYNPATKKISNYDITEGLQDYEFTELAACKRSNGELIFGGVNGFNVFNPMEMKGDTSPPRMVLTEFHVLNQVLNTGEEFNGRIILEQELMSTKRIKLRYAENSIAFHFSALHYAAPEKNKYRYRLIGFDKDWVSTTADNRIAKYTYLPPGRYIFMVEGSNLDGVWSLNPASVEIIVIPPWFRTKVAYMCYLFVIVGLAILFARFNRARNKRKTELKMAHFEKEKVQELSKMKLKFYTNISHEFRTPLTLIIGPVEQLVRDSVKLSEHKRQEFYTIIQRNASILLRLINQLMDFRKLEQEKMELQASPSDIVTFINEIYLSFKDFAEQRSVTFNLQVPAGPIEIWFDDDKLEKVLYNLLSNAFKFTQPKGEVTLSLVEGKNNISITVKDTGLGISEEAQNHIFERFYQSKQIRNRQIGSTGIGLVLSKGFVELHKGSVHFESEVNKGTKFIVNLLKGSDHLSEKDKLGKMAMSREVNVSSYENDEISNTPNQANIGDELNTDGEKPKLLIVEDNDDLRNYLIDCFGARYEVYNAVDGQFGFESCLENQPEIVISDVMMPRMDGFELCSKIKHDENTSHIPIILLTAKTTQEATLKGYRKGADGYVSKPFQFEVLEAQIQSILQSRMNLRLRYHSSTEIVPSEITMTAADARFLERIIKIIEENMRDDKFTVEILADSYGMTQNLLNKKLRALTGLSSKAFIRSIRMKRAAQLLELGRYMVADVTYEVGMNDLKYFRQCFKAEYGVTPSDYIKSKQNKKIDN